ncbi:Uncharacterised protein [Mycobacteroides abscessus subsp. abscessus]|nr:Uncharacterised protein [Mycobacteroides abscessus subsp. abscessus]
MIVADGHGVGVAQCADPYLGLGPWSDAVDGGQVLGFGFHVDVGGRADGAHAHRFGA